MKPIILKINNKGWRVIEVALLQLPGANGIHEFIDELRNQVRLQEDFYDDSPNPTNDESSKK